MRPGPATSAALDWHGTAGAPFDCAAACPLGAGRRPLTAVRSSSALLMSPRVVDRLAADDFAVVPAVPRPGSVVVVAAAAVLVPVVASSTALDVTVVVAAAVA